MRLTWVQSFCDYFSLVFWAIIVEMGVAIRTRTIKDHEESWMDGMDAQFLWMKNRKRYGTCMI